MGLNTAASERYLARFINRQRKLNDIVPDNETNLVRTANLQIDSYKMQTFTAEQEIKWQNNHVIFEALVKSAKKALYIVLKNERITDVELEIVFV